jgi:hypothetical protein
MSCTSQPPRINAMAARVTFDPGGASQPRRGHRSTHQNITHSKAEASIPRVSRRMRAEEATSPFHTSKQRRMSQASMDTAAYREQRRAQLESTTAVEMRIRTENTQAYGSDSRCTSRPHMTKCSEEILRRGMRPSEGALRTVHS